jgi:glyoxylase-like metal-dependent hydrolase (beta-lactamase superfamily II)
MTPAQEVARVAPGIHIWQAYDPAVKADLFSTGLETEAGAFLVDPIQLEPNSLRSLLARTKVAGVFVTNENHVRATAHFAATLSIPVYAHRDLLESAEFSSATGVEDGKAFSKGLTGIAIDGGPKGEMSLHHDSEGGTMIMGDALINFDPHGFGFLPAKYCRDAKQMRRSLRKLLDYRFDRLLFAHGTPILSQARARVEVLLAGGR